MTPDFETNDTGTIRSLNMTQMALVLALKVLDSEGDATPEAIEQRANDIGDLNTFRKELNMEKDCGCAIGSEDECVNILCPRK
jgi:hypothetical protein